MHISDIQTTIPKSVKSIRRPTVPQIPFKMDCLDLVDIIMNPVNLLGFASELVFSPAST